MDDLNKKLSEDEFKDRLVDMYKSKSIKFSDIPKKYREYVALKVFGRYPMRSFSDLLILHK